MIAAGAKPEFFGVPGAAEYAFPLYSVVDAERLRLHLQHLLQDASQSDEGALHVVVVGGGPTGVETSGAVAELMVALSGVAGGPPPGRVTLVDRGAAVLGAFSTKSQEYAAKRLGDTGVEIMLGSGVASVHAITWNSTTGSTIDTRTVVWGGGESAAAIVEGHGTADRPRRTT